MIEPVHPFEGGKLDGLQWVACRGRCGGPAAALDGATAGQRLLRRVQHKACVCRAAYPPAHDAPGVGINDAWNCRFTRSSGQAAAGLLMVV